MAYCPISHIAIQPKLGGRDAGRRWKAVEAVVAPDHRFQPIQTSKDLKFTS